MSKMAVPGKANRWTAFRQGSEDSNSTWTRFMHLSIFLPNTGLRVSIFARRPHVKSSYGKPQRFFTVFMYPDAPQRGNRAKIHTSMADLAHHDWESLRHSQIAETPTSKKISHQTASFTMPPKMYLTHGWLPCTNWHTCCHMPHCDHITLNTHNLAEPMPKPRSNLLHANSERSFQERHPVSQEYKNSA